VALHSAAVQGWPSPDPASGLAARDHSPSLPDPVVPVVRGLQWPE